MCAEETLKEHLKALNRTPNVKGINGRGCREEHYTRSEKYE